jgi:hypothetical protein
MNNLLFNQKFLDADYNSFLSGLNLAWKNFDELAPEQKTDKKMLKKRTRLRAKKSA